MARLYYPATYAPQQTLSVTAKQYHHVTRVRKLKIGDSLTLFNNQQQVAQTIISSCDHQQLTLIVQTITTEQWKPKIHIHLGQIIARPQVMDWMIEKATELGVSSYTPLLDQHTPKSYCNKHRHWQEKIIHACQQSGRNHLMQCNEPLSIENWLAQTTEKNRIALQPGGKYSLKEITTSPKDLALLVGAEAGFSPKSLALAIQHNFSLMGLGPRILRTETAGIAMLSILQYHYGDWHG
jgi:16S rRNA (uracil1498-N3)-methyltransferase